MKNFIRIILFSSVFLTLTSSYAQYSGGSGTIDDPYQISTLEDLKMLSDSSAHLSSSFILIDDIDASSTKTWNNGKGFAPIGRYPFKFSGLFNGNGHVIKNLYISRYGDSGVGLFGGIIGGSVHDLTIENSYVRGTSNVGTLAGGFSTYESSTGSVKNVVLKGCKVTGFYNLGGLIGSMSYGKIEDCIIQDTMGSNSSAIMGGLVGITYESENSWIMGCEVNTVISGHNDIGGLVGINRTKIINCRVKINMSRVSAASDRQGAFAGQNYSEISRCSVEGTAYVNGLDYIQVGGFAGINWGSIWDCSSSVELNAPEAQYVGGFVGQNSGVIKSCYSAGSVIGSTGVGGFAGISTEGSSINNSFSTGFVTGGDRTGGLIGENSYFAKCTNCYASGKVISPAWFSGGLIGLNRSTANSSSCFFDWETSMKSTGIGMDHNGQNQAPEGLSTTEFPVMITFQDKGWVFGNTSQQPWRIGMAPDGHIRPVLSFQKYLVTFLSDTGGSIEPDSLLYQWVTIGNNALSVQAEPLPKYTFYAWFSKNGDSLTSANPLVVTDIHRDTTIIAKYIYYDDIQEIPDYNLKIYPNPACEFITIVCENNFLQEERCFTITDLQGRVHYRKITTDEIISIDINHFIPGTYILSIIRGKAVFNKKIVIN